MFIVDQKLNNRIRKLQESELTLEDMDSEDSNYILEDRHVTCFILCYMHITSTTPNIVILHNNDIFSFNVRQLSLPLSQDVMLNGNAFCSLVVRQVRN